MTDYGPCVLAVNCGSSSVKYKLLRTDGFGVVARGLLERLGEPESTLSHFWRGPDGRMSHLEDRASLPDHRAGVERVFQSLAESVLLEWPNALACVGHRVVHGGEEFRAATLIDTEVLNRIRALTPLAPLHNPANLHGIEAALERAPGVPQVAVFDTAFHQEMPARAYRYALPRRLYEDHGVRRYGFHGISYQYVSREAARALGRPLADLKLIVLHLGHGASAAAIDGGVSVDTSMGLTPLEGLVMGKRSGDIDPAIPFHLHRTLGMGWDDVEDMLLHGSGLEGLCGADDMREVRRLATANDPNARLALEIFAYRIRKYVGAYFAVLGGLDALVFTGGIGEHDTRMRASVCAGLEGLGIVLDPERNQAVTRDPAAIQRAGGPVSVLVVPTDEEQEIARQALQCLNGGP